ncbi:MAG: hypothetical protein FWF56_04845 [Firmicutes bacterium]|nr:hypothetical protein [Bacillota bacterium]MCL1954007.1 hypothetical protein [Bacillota bacterium]
MENNNQSTKTHSINIETRNRGTVTGVDKVISSNDTSINLHTIDGGLHMSGKDFKIKKYSQEEGIISFEGEVDNIKYSQLRTPQKGGILKKMFK